MLFPPENITTDELTSAFLAERKVRLFVLRLDKIHPVVSGNKLFKLHYFLEDALKNKHDTVVTFGGAYSNHLVATAYACRELNLTSIGVVRGEAPAIFSPTLQHCLELNMKLEFVSREEYKIISKQPTNEANITLIPEGGFAPMGACGASHITNFIKGMNATHVVTAVGTGTSLAGLLLNADALQTIIGVPVLKGFTDLSNRLQLLTGTDRYNNMAIFDQYHFGGYAKKTAALIAFMNELYKEYQLPTDFVYTAKMMFAVFEQLKLGFFPEGSRIIALHTGGLQGNQSLPGGTLIF